MSLGSSDPFEDNMEKQLELLTVFSQIAALPIINKEQMEKTESMLKEYDQNLVANNSSNIQKDQTPKEEEEEEEMFTHVKEKDIDEILEGMEQEKQAVAAIFSDLSLKNKENKIKISDLPALIIKLEQTLGIDLKFLAFFIQNYYQREKSFYALSLDEFQRMLGELKSFLVYMRDRSRMRQEETKDSQRKKASPQTFMTAYTLKTSNSKEVDRVNSLKLIVFKIANHKSRIVQILQNHEVEENPNKAQAENENEQEGGKRVIKLGDIEGILDQISQEVGIVMCKNDQDADQATKNDEEGKKDLKQYIFLQLTASVKPQKTFPRAATKSEEQKHPKKVMFIDLEIEKESEAQKGFTVDFFLFIIDKYFSSQSMFIVKEVDQEFQRFLEQEKKEEESIRQMGDVLDDFLLDMVETKKDEVENKVDGRTLIPPEIIQIEKLNKEQNLYSSNPQNPQQEHEPDYGSKLRDVDDMYSYNIEKTIYEYERLVQGGRLQKYGEKEEMVKMIQLLRQQLSAYREKNGERSREESRMSDGNEEDKELVDQRMKGLNEIFHFYSRQHIPQNKQFDDLKECMNEIDLGEFMKFCSDFQIPLSKGKITEIFKKSTQNNKSLKFEQFVIGLGKLGVEMNSQNILGIQKQIMDLKNGVRQGQDSKGQEQKVQEMKQQIISLTTRKKVLEEKTDMEKAIDAFNFIQCQDPSKYRKKIKGFHMAFNIREKDIRVTNEERKRLDQKFRIKNEEMKKNLEFMKQQKLEEQKQKEQSQQDRIKLRKELGDIRKKAPALGINTKSSYNSKMMITFESIEKMNYRNLFLGSLDDNFDPKLILDDDSMEEVKSAEQYQRNQAAAGQKKQSSPEVQKPTNIVKSHQLPIVNLKERNTGHMTDRRTKSTLKDGGENKNINYRQNLINSRPMEDISMVIQSGQVIEKVPSNYLGVNTNPISKVYSNQGTQLRGGNKRTQNYHMNLQEGKYWKYGAADAKKHDTSLDHQDPNAGSMKYLDTYKHLESNSVKRYRNNALEPVNHRDTSQRDVIYQRASQIERAYKDHENRVSLVVVSIQNLVAIMKMHEKKVNKALNTSRRS